MFLKASLLISLLGNISVNRYCRYSKIETDLFNASIKVSASSIVL